LGAYPSPTGTTTPYTVATGTTYSQAPAVAYRPGVKYRRVLNVPLLACPVSGASATVLGIGRFFMTVQADTSAVHAEFVGTASDQQIGGPVEIYK